MRPKQAFTHQIDAPRLGEFDLGGVLYHANYFSLFEATREAFLRAHGMPYTQLIAERAETVALAARSGVFLYGISGGISGKAAEAQAGSGQ